MWSVVAADARWADAQFKASYFKLSPPPGLMQPVQQIEAMYTTNWNFRSLLVIAQPEWNIWTLVHARCKGYKEHKASV